MPELPEVETSRRGIAPFLEQQNIAEVIVRDHRLRWPVNPDLPQILAEQRVHQIGRRAKYLLFDCDSGTLLIHLGMSGRLRVLDASQPLQPDKHDHVDIVFENGYRLRYTDPRRFGAVIWTHEPVELHPLLSHLGPEPLEGDFDADYLLDKASKRQVAIKTFIMNAEIVVGVGNIYASEALFMAGIHPKMITAKLKKNQALKLVEAIKAVLGKAIAAGGTTLRDFRDSEGNPGYFAQELQVYNRAGLGCRQCGHPIELFRQANRATYFCPACQGL